jgi:signal transduction histidine kinase
MIIRGTDAGIILESDVEGAGRSLECGVRRINRTWRCLPPSVLDGGIALVLTVYIEAHIVPAGAPAAAAAMLMTVPLFWRRRSPLLIFCLVVAGVLLTFVLHTTSDPGLIWGAIVASVIAAFSLGLHSGRRVIALGAILAAAIVIVLGFTGQPPPLPDSVMPYLILITPWLVGYAIRSRQQRTDAYRQRALSLERGQELVEHIARAEERARIARELHDVLTHTVSVMVVQATAARRILTVKPEAAQEALLTVESSGRDALTELRSFLGVLTDDQSDIPLAPQPNLAEVETLIQHVREAGLPVELRLQGQTRSLPPDIDIAAYRIVQEALTNALKHSGLAPTQVILDYAASELTVEVLDEGTHERARSYGTTGRGLIGMRERVALCSGVLEAGPRHGGGYAVRACLPLVERGA